MTTKRELRPRQQRILAYIEQFLEENGMPPTVRDIQRGCEISGVGETAATLVAHLPELGRGNGKGLCSLVGLAPWYSGRYRVDYNLRLLERYGYLKRRSEIARGIELLDETGLPVNAGSTRVQIVGSIAAGEPIPAFSSEGAAAAAEFDIVEVRPELKKKHGTLFALSVKGTSMIDALIDDGDVVVITPTNTAQNGEMVVAWLKEEEEATLKKFYREGRRVRLQPANSTMDPIYADADNVEIRGRVVEVLRQF